MSLFKKLFSLGLITLTGFIYYKLFTGKEREIEKIRKRFVMARNHGPSIKDDDQYKIPRKNGMSDEKAARITTSLKTKTDKKGHEEIKYEVWTKYDLYEKAKNAGIKGRSKMNKNELIVALRNYSNHILNKEGLK